MKITNIVWMYGLKRSVKKLRTKEDAIGARKSCVTVKKLVNGVNQIFANHRLLLKCRKYCKSFSFIFLSSFRNNIEPKFALKG